jgi:Domain of unknown function DUF29
MSGEYDTDIVLWSEHQAALLRRLAAGERVNDQLDFPHLIEEIEDVGGSVRRALRSHITSAIEHLIKLQASPATSPRRCWVESVLRARAEIDGLLQEGPSLRGAVADMVADQTRRAKRTVAQTLALYGETARVDIAALQYAPDQVISDWLPPDLPP